MRRISGACLAVLLVFTLSACADESSAEWPVPPAEIFEFDGMLWAKGDTIGDLSGPLFEVDPAPGFFVAAGGGVYYGARKGGLYYATADGVTPVPRTAVPSTLRASPDRRWLAFIDETPHPDEAVVVDTRSGTEVLRTSENMENGTGPDDLYPEGQHPQIELVTDEAVWIRTDDGYLKFSPESGDLDDGPFDFEGDYNEGTDGWIQPWFVDRRGTPSGQGSWNASRTWYVSRYYDPGMFISKDGRKVAAMGDRPAHQLDLRGWVDDSTAYGYAGVFLIACELATFTCAKVPGAEGERDATGRAHRAHFANGYF